ncbi:hypothetical protein Tco_0545474 [Tanacetum coccineum]
MMGVWRCGGDDGDEGGGDDVDGSVGVKAVVDGDDFVGGDDDGEVVMERSGDCWPEVAGKYDGVGNLSVLQEMKKNPNVILFIA